MAGSTRNFGSKQELQEAAVAYGQSLSAGRAQSYGAKKRKASTVAALAQEIVHSTPELKAAF
jgi:TetR/AcrR family transcriptional regulator, transcriptional repressor for nem operon